ncbi:PhaM family polyhydroxyalkanoate granule multifunctional regulatory protein [Ramlibacter sp. AN1015]|uniref:PhaM family polyhydroxyalkanoate granule multifunctional regulatory protein n=1 Tax=Ramlibacter sp. AN1015 TaxID=3133428 RepID=UPI0030BBD6B4
MSDAQNFGFGKFVPGFDFLQNLAKGASDAMPQMPGLSSWVAPTLSVEELDRRISELRAVMFWLEQNGKALGATIQALEVQRMTLATLKGMDVTMSDLAESLKVTPQAAPPAPKSAPAAPSPSSAAAAPASAAPGAARTTSPAGGSDGSAAQLVDPLQWWGALTQQFQQIAATALKEANQNSPMEAARDMATGMAQEALKNAGRMTEAMAPAAGAAPAPRSAKAPARKSAARSPAGAPRKASPRSSAAAKRGAGGAR